jgi:hypothetical protein
MQNLTRAHDELYRRRPDERFLSIPELWDHCCNMKQWSTERWVTPAELTIKPEDSEIQATFQEKSFRFTDWSFGNICSFPNSKS